MMKGFLFRNKPRRSVENRPKNSVSRAFGSLQIFSGMVKLAFTGFNQH